MVSAPTHYIIVHVHILVHFQIFRLVPLSDCVTIFAGWLVSSHFIACYNRCLFYAVCAACVYPAKHNSLSKEYVDQILIHFYHNSSVFFRLRYIQQIQRRQKDNRPSHPKNHQIYNKNYHHYDVYILSTAI